MSSNDVTMRSVDSSRSLLQSAPQRQSSTGMNSESSSTTSHNHLRAAGGEASGSSSQHPLPPPSPSNTSQSENDEDEGEGFDDDVVGVPERPASFRDARRNTIKGSRPPPGLTLTGGADEMAEGSSLSGDRDVEDDVGVAKPRSLGHLSGSIAPAGDSDAQIDEWLRGPAAIAPAQPQPSASHLPHEILLHIFKYVAAYPPDLRACVSVSKAWCVCGVELLWHRPTFYNVQALQKLTSVMTNPNATFDYASFVRRLNFALLNETLDDDLFRPMRACVRLERLTLQGCSLISDEALQDVLSQTKNLVAIDLTDVTKVRDSAIDVLAASCPRLQGINLSGCAEITSTSVAKFAKACNLLRRVKLCHCTGVGDDALTALTAHCPTLLEVDLLGCPDISDFSVREIWRKSFHMRELRLAQCGSLTDLAFPAPASSLGGHRGPSLAELQWGGAESAPTSRGASPAVAGGSDDRNGGGLPRTNTLPLPPPMAQLAPPRLFDHLRILDLTNSSSISDAAVEGIISSAPRIRNLVLAKCTRLTDESVYAISRLGKNLHYLHLGHVSNITDRAVTHLARSCTRLRYIDLACCQLLTDASVFELALNLPKLRRIGLVRVLNLTDQAIYSLVDRHTCLERIHLSYCENISIPAVFWLLQRLTRLTHLSLTGVPAFRRPELQEFCRSPPKDFNEHQRNAFCVYSGKGVNDLRRYLQAVYQDQTNARIEEFGHLRPEVAQAMAQLSAQHEHRSSRSARHVTSAAAAAIAAAAQRHNPGASREPLVWSPAAMAEQARRNAAETSMSLDDESFDSSGVASGSGSRSRAVPSPMQVDSATPAERSSSPGSLHTALNRFSGSSSRTANQLQTDGSSSRYADVPPTASASHVRRFFANGHAVSTPESPTPVATFSANPHATSEESASAHATLTALATPPLDPSAPTDDGAEGSSNGRFANAVRGTFADFTRYRG